VAGLGVASSREAASTDVGSGFSGGANKILAVYDFARGLDYNWTCTLCANRTHVAVTSNGNYFVTATDGLTTNLMLYTRISTPRGLNYTDSANWQNPGGVSAVTMADNATGIAVLAPLASGAAHNNLTLYDSAGTSIWSFPSGAGASWANVKGDLTSVVMSRDGNWIAAAGTGQNGTGGVVYLFKSTSAAPAGSWAAPSVVTSLAITPDGSVVAATSGSHVSLFTHDSRGFIPEVVTATGTLPAAAKAIAIDRAANDIAVATASGVSLFAPVNNTWSKLWDASLAGADAVAMNANGKVIVAGNAQGAVAYAEGSATPLYTQSGAALFAGIDDAGDRAAFASGSSLSVYHQVPLPSINLVDANGTSVANQSPPAANPGQTLRFYLSITNGGSAPDRGTLTATPDQTANVVINRTLIGANTIAYAVNPGERDRVEIDVTPGQVVPQIYTIPLHLVSAVSGAQVNASIDYGVGGASGISLFYPNATKDFVIAQAGQGQTLSFSVENLGNAPAEFTLAVHQQTNDGISWPISLYPNGSTHIGPLTASGPGIAPAQLTITSPSTAPSGATDDVTITATATNGSASYLPLEFTFVVNPIVALNMTADQHARVVTAGNSGWFNVTLINTGSVPAEFQIYSDPVVSSLPGVAWNVNVSGLNSYGLVALQPGQTQLMRVLMLSPNGAPPGAVGLLHLYGIDFNPTSHARPHTQQYLNLSTSVVAPPHVITTTNVPVIPAPETAAVVATIFVAAAAMTVWRRRE
jgi:hypothetical protein